jgi:hypothetical protein
MLSRSGKSTAFVVFNTDDKGLVADLVVHITYLLHNGFRIKVYLASSMDYTPIYAYV